MPLAGECARLGYRRVVSQPAIAERTAFAVSVAGFEGPFDLLLSLIAKHRLEVTALAIHQVTDDFVAHLKAQGDAWDLDETTEFLVVAAILLDLKAARLLPGDSVEDEEDLALLEARDLLFARLLQYRAFKEASAHFGELLYGAPPRLPREVGLDPDLAGLLPDVTISLSSSAFAELAVRALTPKEPEVVSTAHIHSPTVSVRDQATIMVTRLRRGGQLSFRSLISDCPDVVHIVARFLGLLELYGGSLVAFEQAGPLGDLLVRWTGGDHDDVSLTAEFDDDDEADSGPREAGEAEEEHAG